MNVWDTDAQGIEAEQKRASVLFSVFGAEPQSPWLPGLAFLLERIARSWRAEGSARQDAPKFRINI
jgi:hypothetical protein